MLETEENPEMSRHEDDKYSIRKSKKPLMEKRRRQRINNCLGQLKTLVLQAMKKDTAHYSKLEKADILEMTVKHLRSMQRRQISSALAADPSVAAKYRVGFNECAHEVVRYLNSLEGVNDDVRCRLMNHLSGCVQSVNPPTVPLQTQTPIQPLQVQIPTTQGGTHIMHPHPDRLLMSQSCYPQPPSVDRLQTSPPNTQVAGSYELVPGNMYSGPVAVYLGQSSETHELNNGVSLFSLQLPQQHSSKVVGYGQNNVSSHGHQNSLLYRDIKSRQMCDSKLLHLNTRTSPVCSAMSSAIKDEKLWRPW